MLLDALARQVHASLENRYLHAQAWRCNGWNRTSPSPHPSRNASSPPICRTSQATKWRRQHPIALCGGDYYDCIRWPTAGSHSSSRCCRKGVPRHCLSAASMPLLPLTSKAALPCPSDAATQPVICMRDRLISSSQHFLDCSHFDGRTPFGECRHNPVYWRRGNERSTS